MSIPYVRQFDFEYGRCDTLSPLVQRVIADNPGPFTYTGTGVFIIGDKNVCVIDPGPNTKAHQKALDQALENRTVSHILLTHHHSDHSPLAKPLAQAHKCQVYGMSLKQKFSMDTDVKLEAGNDPSFAPDVELTDGDVIKGDGWMIEALHTPGHTSNHLCFALKEENTLFSGDHVMGWSTSVVVSPDGDMGDYMNSLEKIYDRHFDLIRPTHGPVIKNVDNFVQAYIDHRLNREKQVLKAINEGLYNIFDIVTSLYADVDKRLHPAAAHSVLSHVIQLRQSGEITASGKDGLSKNYFPLTTS